MNVLCGRGLYLEKICLFQLKKENPQTLAIAWFVLGVLTCWLVTYNSLKRVFILQILHLSGV